MKPKAKSKTALLVIDMQPDFYPGGPLAVPAGDEIVEPIAELMANFELIVCTQDSHPEGHISFASSYGMKAFEILNASNAEAAAKNSHFNSTEILDYLKQTPEGFQVLWPDHCVKGSKGWELDSRLPLERVSLILRKGTKKSVDSYSAFFENDGSPTGLAGFLREREVECVYCVGLAGDYCVLWTAQDALKSGFKVIFNKSLTRFVGFPEGSQQRAIASLKSLGAEFV